MKNQNYKKGKLGEQIARDYLIKKGYRIIRQNFQTRFGELDIVAGKDNLLIFIEVKLKVEADFGRPEEMITQKKLRQVKNTAEMFLMQEKTYLSNFKQYRIDAICIILNQDMTVKEIRHYENLTG
ncbi:hypothetical protein COS55_03240 [Candidatus Shapirobacteria bacterium CG03_land_8_20_14_0_80_40_19]|uniref:UPF0102 protein COS55_03240 n=4 Tax=Candidatus Shapironibacteriota TaxID=1752721 RepID=A0A2M7BC68_9BACT|nr:MAG: hypothetical protein COV89_03255 [Candidatus Shapirobacteria bacterium CG11_big_fil_rev_8_21_14_0_20_40_12]PIV00650.1 MAG: hypothetical protein COS55_03240 [Candidatus Shapirobacteria bacterium CG03_land_8_20_14_0_80_40_19]PJC29049.1 MAG: hypothetical protein CO053_01365 [Candidatus Shapirobacteria bacterium CG_4_9_14_0_2_um_filter_40_11]PJC76570.1 MAG: hypothetical protein CO010_02445 [Candidatus Shapirobacteria bacterium CG_4_8_14_3_um_filter_39_11]